MCGIVGIVGVNASVPADLLERATRSLLHRGPDDRGTILLRPRELQKVEVGLGNTRLAIIDLSPQGHQPMNDPSTGNWIVYNGEIYNFRDLRSRLQREGVEFRSQSDTEVVLKAYSRWGVQCLKEFRGMFAFAIWDETRQRLFVARDPMGIKPLYYYQSERYFLFASEVRTLLETGLVPRKIDGAGLQNYLTFGSIYDPNTLIQDVRALLAGNYLTWENGSATQTEYWDLVEPHEASLSDRDSSTASQKRIAEMLEECIRMQLVSDVPAGVFLSGGIDSSAIVAMLSRSGVRPSTFSIVFREPEYSEAEYSRAIAEKFRTDHHEISVSQSDFLATVDPAISAMDQPTIDGINTYFVSERTRSAGVKVALSGLGGDELFAGYSNFRNIPRMEKFSSYWADTPAVLRNAGLRAFAAVASSNDRNHKLAVLAREDGRNLHPYFLSRMLFTPDQRNSLLCDGTETEERSERPLSETLKRAAALDPVNRVSYLESRCYMLNTLLRDSDCMSMANGVEVRVPLIDHQLARYLMTLPGSWKLSDKLPKPLLVGSLNGDLPDQIVRRPKKGFTMPFEQWLRGQMRNEVERCLHSIAEGGLHGSLNQPAIERVWQDFLAQRTSWSRPWSLYVLQSWVRRHLAN